jgi:3-deoxy-D-manno-octulosonic-acid transferase
MTSRPKAGAQLKAYLGLRVMLQPLMPLILRRRVARGKDDPARWQEKMGCASVKRPPGTVIWVHAVGLGEVMALRPLLAEMFRQSPNISFVITSTARSSDR